MRHLTASVILLGLAAFAALTSAGEKAKPFVHSADETKIFELTNQERKKQKLPALALNPALSKIARAHSANMARQGKMEHKLDGKEVDGRMKDAGYKWANAGENLAAGEKGASLPAIMKEWMESKSHRANILEEDYTEIGVGIAVDKAGEMFITQVFGRPLKE